MKRCSPFLAVLVLLPVLSASAFSGKTLYHYVAYEAAFWPKNLPATAENYPKVALARLSSLTFDTLVFAPTFGFGSMAAKLNSADFPTVQPAADSKWLAPYRNAMPELAKKGVDPLAETVKWCRAHKKEAVVALPVNLLIHGQRPSGKTSLGSWYAYLWPSFKSRNPGALMDPDGKAAPPFASAVAVDYGHAKVRDTFSAIACEIAGKYDIDGLMVDFMMNPMLFRSVAMGGAAEPKEVEALTQMMQKIGAACKGAASRLGHPVTFCARVPDSVAYCKDIGLNLSVWLEAKLLDAVVLGGPFQLNRWNATGDLVRKAGLPYYASFAASGIYVGNDSGYISDDERLPRQSRATYAARIADALLCKASGCMYSMAMHHELGWIPLDAIAPFDAAANRMADKRYFVSSSNDRAAGRFLKDGARHAGVESLLSNSPVSLAKGVAKYHVNVWDDVSALKGGDAPKATLVTEVSIPSGVETVVTFNGKELKPFKKRAGTQLYEIPPVLLRFGANEVTVKAKGKNRRGEVAKLGNIAVELAYPKKGGAK